MTTMAKQSKISQFVNVSIPINVMHMKFIKFTFAANAFFRKIQKCKFSVIHSSFFIRWVFFTTYIFLTKTNCVFFAKEFVLTFFATCCSVFSDCFSKVRNFSAIFTSERNLFFSVKRMKTCFTAKTPSIISLACRKFNFTVFTNYYIFGMSRFLSARNTTKDLSFLIRSKSVFA